MAPANLAPPPAYKPSMILGRSLTDEQRKALKRYPPINESKHRLTLYYSRRVANTLYGLSTNNSDVFDVIVGSCAIEVKVLAGTDLPKVTVPKAKAARMVASAKFRHFSKTFTIVVDTRFGNRQFYYQPKITGSATLDKLIKFRTMGSLPKYILG